MMRTLVRMIVVSAFVASSLAYGEEAVKFRFLTALYTDGEGGMLNAPQGVACGAGSQIVVANTGNGRVSRYRYENGAFSAAGEQKWPELARPSRLQVNSQGDLYALDEKQRRIVRFSSAGEFRGYVEPAAKHAAGPFVPRSFKLDARDNVYVLDVRSERVAVLDPSGALLRTINFPGGYGFFSDLAVAANGTVYVLDSVQRMVFAAAPSAQDLTPLTASLREYMLFPSHLAVDGTGMLYLTDQNGSAILLMSQTGAVLSRQSAAGWKEGLLRYPSQLCISASGDVFVADRENNRIQVFATSK